MACNHSVPCTALYPCNNKTGSWTFLNLSTKQFVRYLQWKKIRTIEAIISQMNMFDPEPIWQLPVIQQDVLEREEKPEPLGEQVAVLPAMQVEPVVPVSTVPGTQVIEEPMVEVAGAEEEPQNLMPQEPDDLDDKPEDDDINNDEEDDAPQVGIVQE
jgi:hypothetical protein